MENNEPKIKEVEAKYSVSSEERDVLVKNLKKMGAVFLEKTEETDIYYSRPDKDFMKTKECLRIRITPKFSELTYKPGTTDKMRLNKKFWKKEVNIKISGQEEKAEEFLNDLGYKKLVEIKKERTIYSIYDLIIALDRVNDLGDFVELEIKSHDEIYALETLESYEMKLGLKEGSLVDLPYRDLLMNKKDE